MQSSYYNTYYGSEALLKNLGDNNTAFGYNSLKNIVDPSCNTGVGSFSLLNNISGPHNTGLGAFSMYYNASGGFNTAIGSNSLTGRVSKTTIGDRNVAVGYQALLVNSGNENTCVGTNSLLSNTDGSYNTAVGFSSGSTSANGLYNSYLGYSSGSNGVNGLRNTYLGANSGPDVGDTNVYQYSTAVGSGAITDASNQIKLGRPGGQDTVIVPGAFFAKEMTLTAVGYPTGANSVMPKAYIDSLASGIKPIGSVSCLANTGDPGTPINLGIAPPAQIDGYTLQNGNPVLINDQTNKINNGVWIANVGVNWTRPTAGNPMSIGYDAKNVFTFVTNGNTHARTGWLQINSPAIVGTDPLLFSQYYQLNYQLGQGLELVGPVLQVKSDLSGFLTNISVAGPITQTSTGTITQTGTGTNSLKPTVIVGDLSCNSLNASARVTAASVRTLSDYRIKKNIRPLNLDKYNVDNLNPVIYKNKLLDKEDIGLIAHEVQEYFPFMVSGEKDIQGSFQSINYTSLVGILIKEIQDLKARVKELENDKRRETQK